MVSTVPSWNVLRGWLRSSSPHPLSPSPPQGPPPPQRESSGWERPCLQSAPSLPLPPTSISPDFPSCLPPNLHPTHIDHPKGAVLQGLERVGRQLREQPRCDGLELRPEYRDIGLLLNVAVERDERSKRLRQACRNGRGLIGAWRLADSMTLPPISAER